MSLEDSAPKSFEVYEDICPFIGLLGQKYGIRRITVIGGLVAGLGSILCYSAPSVEWITAFWGVIHGTGFGLSTVLHMMVISQYFDKYKASALGLGYSGDCFGTFAFPVIMEHLLSTYDVKGTFLILGGIVLNVIPLAMMLKKPPWLKEKPQESKNSEPYKANEGFPISDKTISEEDQELSTFSPSSRSASLCKDCMSERHDSLPPLYGKEETKGEDSAVKKGRTSSVVSQIAQELVHRVRSASFASQITQDGFITPLQKENLQAPPKQEAERMNSVVSNCSTLQDLVLSVNGFRKTEEPTTLVMVKTNDKPTGILSKLLRLNTKPIFVLISLSMAAYSFLFVGVLTIIIDYAKDNDVSSDDGKYLIIGFSVTDLIGRLSFGVLLDRRLIKMKNYSGVTLLLMGTFVAALPFNKSFNFMLVFMCMYGLVQGGSAIMFPILISYYMKKNEESLAMGCLNFAGGLLMLMLAPMIGYFRDSMKSYDWVFHIVGGVTSVVGLLWQFEPFILQYQERRKQRRLNYVIVTKL